MFSEQAIAVQQSNSGYRIETINILNQPSSIEIHRHQGEETYQSREIAELAAQSLAETQGASLISSQSNLAFKAQLGRELVLIELTPEGHITIRPRPQFPKINQNYSSYVSYLENYVVYSLNIPFNLVIDHHLSWDETGHWADYFKRLYTNLPSSDQKDLLHAAIKVICVANGYDGCDERLQRMLSNPTERCWENDQSALKKVITTAKNLSDQELNAYLSHLQESVVPSLNVPFDLGIDHHLSWDKKGTWATYFKKLHKNLSNSGQEHLLHAAMKEIYVANGYTGSEERLQNMILEFDENSWKNVQSAFINVITTAKQCFDKENR